MNEKQYNALGTAGAASLVIGILSVVFGITGGVLMIINGAKTLNLRKRMLI